MSPAPAAPAQAMNDQPAPLALTPGEPAGIGPDLCIALAGHPLAASVVIVADPELLRRRAALLGAAISIHCLDAAARPPSLDGPGLRVLPVALAATETPGRLDTRNAPYVLETLRRAVDGCLAGEFAGLVTGPVHKGLINEAGIPFSGHTEFLAARTGGQPVMLLACPGLRVALATTHLPLSDVAGAITAARLERVLRVLHGELEARFRITRPCVLVCGLNPHGGEGGHLGREELEVIGPTLERLRAEGMDLRGPLPADTAFTPPMLREADAVLAMYHDQGLPVLKHLGFGHSVNVTLGLPIVRTSVDHGTALELAGTGRAQAGSLLAAIELALELGARATARP